MEDFQAYCKPAYKCGLCGEEFTNVKDRSACEVACLLKKQEEEKKAAEAKKNEEKKTDFSEASAALDNALALVNKCIEKHGSFHYSGKASELDLSNMDFFPSKLWHHFWF